MKHIYLLAHRLESQAVERIHIWLNKWLTGMDKGLILALTLLCLL